METRGAMVSDTWRMGRRFSGTEGCWYYSAAIQATSSMDTEPTAACLDAGPETPQSALVRMSTEYEPSDLRITLLFKIAEPHFPQLCIRNILNLPCYRAADGQTQHFESLSMTFSLSFRVWLPKSRAPRPWDEQHE